MGFHYIVAIALSTLMPHVSAVGQNLDHSIHHGGLQDFDSDSEPENQLHRDDFVANREHIQAHLKDEAKIDLDSASEEEVAFHFFKLHDLDGDSKLDGLELLNAISHSLEEQINRINKIDISTEERLKRLERIKARHVSSVDRILKDDDKNDNGYLEYFEYAASRRTTAVLKRSAKKQGL